MKAKPEKKIEKKSEKKKERKQLNRIRVILADQSKTNLWLANQMGVSHHTVSKWCTNFMQPSLETFVKIAEVLNVNVHDLISPTSVK